MIMWYIICSLGVYYHHLRVSKNLQSDYSLSSLGKCLTFQHSMPSVPRVYIMGMNLVIRSNECPVFHIICGLTILSIGELYRVSLASICKFPTLCISYIHICTYLYLTLYLMSILTRLYHHRAVGATSFLVPFMELFWYLMSMYVLENERGKRWANKISSLVDACLPPPGYVCKSD